MFRKNGCIEASVMINIVGAETVLRMCIVLEAFENGRTRRVMVKVYAKR